ncbi:flagellar assembly peptidoglycan hydrolase FlgJ [Shewanella salipaludis]|uniref:Peptidoglycan hydrolase FlgJ n=1 Tax=Shewanella salipaludis TaxID=2723052 RepID=A0A972JIX5_9GAMM|nr:flagellar assembly peptidoglycan hydrolase FlgJ [Shewanella salipaludis]NMH65543.1 flagellar assembly peptidoglycan hydrolase FlgJ [Shewanella salipaludis]
MEKLSNSSHFLDLGGLDSLRSQAQQDQKGALQKVAKQFEGIFVQMLMKSMRDANAVFESDSPMNSQYTKFYEQMRDQQLSVDLSDKGVLGLADMMVQQLSPEGSKVTPASVLRGELGASPARQHDTAAAIPPVATAATTAGSQPELLFPSRHHRTEASPQTADGILAPILSGKSLPSAATPTQANATFDSRDEFVTRLYPHAEKAAKALGTSPELLLAQSALETGWGQKMVRRSDGACSNNLFNIKADKRWDGDKTSVNTLEFEQGIAVKQKADFRMYDNVEQSFNDFVSFITEGERYQEARQVAAEPAKFIKALQQAGYATDPHYADKVIKVMKSITAEFKTLIPGETR